MKNRKIALVCATALANALVTGAAIAQTNGSGSGSAAAGTAEIVVTAQRRTERLQDVPVSVSVLAGETLAKQNVSSLESVSNRSSSLVIRPAPGGDQIAIRGMSSGFNPGFEQSVATFVDGIYRPRARSIYTALFDLERLEVLKGPQTTFFGANAIAGALNITTRKPKDEFGANALGYFSPDDNEFKFEAGVDVPMGENFAFRLAGRLNDMDAIAKDTRLDKRGKQKTGQLRLSAKGTLSDRISIDGRFDYARIRYSGTIAQELTRCPPPDIAAAGQCARSLNLLGEIDNKVDRKFQSGFLDRTTSDLYEGAVTTTVDLGGADLVSTTGYQDLTLELAYPATSVPVPSPLGVDTTIVSNNGENFKQFSQELRLQSSGDGPLNYMVGGYYEWGKTNSYLYLGIFTAPLGSLYAPQYFTATDLMTAGTDATQKSETWSGFASLSYELTSQLKASVGLRYSRVKKTADRSPVVGTVAPWASGETPYLRDIFTPGPIAGQVLLAPVLGVNLAPFPVQSITDDQWMPSANISYHFTPDVMTYVSYAHGFKAGGYNLFLSNDIFGPEKADAYEFGVKAAWLNRRLTTNVTFFQTEYNDLQESGNIFLESGAFIPFIGNVAKSRAKGVEFETSAVLADGFTLNASLAYLESKYRDFPNAPCSPYQAILAGQPDSGVVCPQPNLKGVTRSNAPKWSGSVSADYTREVNSSLKAGLGATAYFRSKYYLQSIPEDITSQEGFAKVDMRASLGSIDNAWELSIIGQNIFDKTTVVFGAGAPGAPGSTQFIADRGRSVGLQLRVNFGSSQ